jgi:hypothetical protein
MGLDAGMRSWQATVARSTGRFGTRVDAVPSGAAARITAPAGRGADPMPRRAGWVDA